MDEGTLENYGLNAGTSFQIPNSSTYPTVSLTYPNNHDISVHSFLLRGSVVARQQQVHVPVPRIPLRARRSCHLRTRPSSLALDQFERDKTGKIIFSSWTKTEFFSNKRRPGGTKS